MGLRIANRRRFAAVVGLAAAAVLAVTLIVVQSGGDNGGPALSTVTSVRRTTTTASTTTTTLLPTTTAALARTTTSARRSATATTAKTTTTTAAPICGPFRASYTYESESSEMMHISLVGNTTFGGRPVTFDMQYLAPAGGAPSYPTEQYNGPTKSYYTLHFRVTKSMDGGGLSVRARADGVESTCQSQGFKTNCCLGPEPAPEP